jgi:hypothetical protein
VTRAAEQEEHAMEFLEDETEARYAWDTAALFARRQRLVRIAPQVRPIVMRSVLSPYKDPRTGREQFEQFFARSSRADYPPGWEPCTGRQLHDALKAGWKPTLAPPHSAYALYMAQQTNY